MNNEGNYEKKLIKEFLDEVELKLPFWLKNEKEELKEVLKELEEHIEDKTEELENSGEADTTLKAVQIAISQMGSPAQIAREYKRRGTPKFFITEELFQMYLTVLKYAGIAVGLIAVAIIPIRSLVIGLTGGNWGGAIFQGLSSLLIWSVIVAAGISVLFVWLSYEGYFPEDIKKIFKSKEKLKTEKLESVQHLKTIIYTPKIEVEPIQLPKTMIDSPKIEESEIEYPKRLDKTHSLVAWGIVTLVVGMIAVIQPFTELTALLDQEFLNVLIGIGVFWILFGIFGIIHGIFVSWSYQANEVFYPVRALISLASISMVILLLMNPQVFPLPVWTAESGLQIFSIAPEFYWIYYLVLSIIIVGIIATAIYNFYKGASLDEDYFYMI
ncbi:MAG: permease prefix domain 1-containing protein [Promethearchaeota archaeon]